MNKPSRIYESRMPKEVQRYHAAQNQSPINWRPLTMGGSTRVEPGTMYNIPIRISGAQFPTHS